MQITTGKLEVNEVLLYGEKLAEKFVSGEAKLPHVKDALDYCVEVMLAANSEELLDAMHYSLLEKNIGTEREDEKSVVAAFIAGHDESLWEMLINTLSEIVSGTTDGESEMENDEQLVMYGYDLFFTNMKKNKVKEMMNVLVESAGELHGKTFAAENYGNEWGFTCMFEKGMEIKSAALMDVVIFVRKLGQALAEGVGCTYNGSDVQVNKAAFVHGKAAGLMGH